MQQVLAHLSAHPYIYASIGIILILVVIVMMVDRYETLMIRNLFTFAKHEGFQNEEEVANAAVPPITIPQEYCEGIKKELANYEEIKITHKNVRIQNLDETIAMLKNFIVSYKCE
jgi:hypothetical protein